MVDGSTIDGPTFSKKPSGHFRLAFTGQLASPLPWGFPMELPDGIAMVEGAPTECLAYPGIPSCPSLALPIGRNLFRPVIIRGRGCDVNPFYVLI
jgi:hypothetical protein